ncbi:Usp (universal stress protein) family protein [Pseudohyphozyma bogoriensis]|nr:Usp (universal stress protein) family protein [Pseudohyphozyma bogoriensis]
MSSPRQLIDIPVPRGERSRSRNRMSNPRLSTSPTSPSHQLSSSPPLRSALKQPKLSPGLTDSSFSLHDAIESGRQSDESRGREGGPEAATPGSASSLSLAPTFVRRVGFDTMESSADLESSGNVNGGGTEYSTHALYWAINSLAEDNDELVIMRVIDPAEKEKPGTVEEAREEAEGVMEQVMKKIGDERQLSLVVEFSIGPVEETIHRIIEIYKPDSLIVGTRGLPDSIWKSAMMGSISRYCVAKSPVPVVVVRPEGKVRESLSRRIQDPKRRSYVSLLSPTSDSLALERTTTAPVRGTSKDRSGSLEREKPKTKAEAKAAKEAKKGKEFKKFGTFS